MRKMWQKSFSVKVDQMFLKVHAKNCMKIVRMGDVICRMIPPIITLSRITDLTCIHLRTGVVSSSLTIIIGNELVKKHTRYIKNNICLTKQKVSFCFL